MKIIRPSRRIWLAVALGASLLASTAKTRANLNYIVTLNTLSLVGNTNAPFSLDLALSSGSQTPNSDNTVTLSNFLFYNGTAGAMTYSSGGQSGTTASTVLLTTSAEDNEFAQAFSNSVTEIQFNVSMTSNTNNPFPDQFYVSILDSGLNNIPTTDPSGGNTLLLLNINTAQTLSSVATYRSTPGGEAPGVTASAVPEPTTTAGLLAGVVALALYARRRLQGGAVAS